MTEVEAETTRQYVLSKYPSAICTRSPSSGGWKVYDSNGWAALSFSHDEADKAWEDAAVSIKKREEAHGFSERI